MRVQFCKAGPNLVLESAVVEEIEVQFTPGGGLTFMGRQGEEWSQVAYFDPYDAAAIVPAKAGAVHDIAAVFISNEGAESVDTVRT